jgi:hypothetical protein
VSYFHDKLSSGLFERDHGRDRNSRLEKNWLFDLRKSQIVCERISWQFFALFQSSQKRRENGRQSCRGERGISLFRCQACENMNGSEGQKFQAVELDKQSNSVGLAPNSQSGSPTDDQLTDSCSSAFVLAIRATRMSDTRSSKEWTENSEWRQ